MKIFPAIDHDMLRRLREEAEEKLDELDRETVDLADTITQWQANKLKLQEAMRRRRDDK